MPLLSGQPVSNLEYGLGNLVRSTAALGEQWRGIREGKYRKAIGELDMALALSTAYEKPEDFDMARPRIKELSEKYKVPYYLATFDARASVAQGKQGARQAAAQVYESAYKDVLPSSYVGAPEQGQLRVGKDSPLKIVSGYLYNLEGPELRQALTYLSLAKPTWYDDLSKLSLDDPADMDLTKIKDRDLQTAHIFSRLQIPPPPGKSSWEAHAASMFASKGEPSAADLARQQHEVDMEGLRLARKATAPGKQPKGAEEKPEKGERSAKQRQDTLDLTVKRVTAELGLMRQPDLQSHVERKALEKMRTGDDEDLEEFLRDSILSDKKVVLELTEKVQSAKGKPDTTEARKQVNKKIEELKKQHGMTLAEALRWIAESALMELGQSGQSTALIQ